MPLSAYTLVCRPLKRHHRENGQAAVWWQTPPSFVAAAGSASPGFLQQDAGFIARLSPLPVALPLYDLPSNMYCNASFDPYSNLRAPDTPDSLSVQASESSNDETDSNVPSAFFSHELRHSEDTLLDPNYPNQFISPDALIEHDVEAHLLSNENSNDSLFSSSSTTSQRMRSVGLPSGAVYTRDVEYVTPPKHNKRPSAELPLGAPPAKRNSRAPVPRRRALYPIAEEQEPTQPIKYGSITTKGRAKPPKRASSLHPLPSEVRTSPASFAPLSYSAAASDRQLEAYDSYSASSSDTGSTTSDYYDEGSHNGRPIEPALVFPTPCLAQSLLMYPAPPVVPTNENETNAFGTYLLPPGVCAFRPGAILVGNDEAADNLSWLSSRGITAILSCHSSFANHFATAGHFVCCQAYPKSTTQASMEECLIASARFLLYQMEHGAVTLVHCTTGQSLSLGIIFAYLIVVEHIPYTTCLAIAKRRGAKPNFEPVLQLALQALEM